MVMGVVMAVRWNPNKPKEEFEVHDCLPLVYGGLPITRSNLIYYLHIDFRRGCVKLDMLTKGVWYG